ncbi:MAG: type VI secretion system membrane subunit TssM [Pseudomonadota bacterium]|nr:type VI secretion system membrane subunit TssM [Pseudomonadota bacterium]
MYFIRKFFRFFRLIFNRWILLALLVAAFLALVWIIGPLVTVGDWRPFDTTKARWITSGVFVVLVLGIASWRVWRAKRGNRKVVDQLMTAPAAGPSAPVESADMAAVRERFETALKTLRNARFGSAAEGGLAATRPSRWARIQQSLTGRFLYELPWYTIIGAPGSGKTTALRNAGLRFPLAEHRGGASADAVRGVGGTRNCDWWFTDQAVLIDTAGRFVTQDSDRANDQATWAGFLQLLKKSRPRQPLNGVLVTVSVADLIAKSPAERARHAEAVRARMQELHEQLAVRLPIYLLVTKCDLLAGFSETFAALDKDRRATPWGYTVALDGPNAQDARTALVPEFDALLQRLDQGLVDRLQSEPDPQRRALIYAFPNQFANLRELLQEFVQQVFSPSPFEARPMLRGVYFVSGTQEGSPIDRVLGAVSRHFRLEQQMLPPQHESGRSYFLQRLLKEVVFAEQGIAGTHRGFERRRGALALAGYALLAMLALGLSALWLISYGNNKAYIETVGRRVEAVRKDVQETPNRATSELRPILSALDATRGLAVAGEAHAEANTLPAAASGVQAGADDEPSVPWSLGFGLYQGRKLDSAARVAYQHMLVDAVLPRLAMRVEEQLRAGEQTESLYEALKVYLMMSDPAHFEPDALKAHFENDWDQRLGRELSTAEREAMSRHLDALLALGATVSPLPIDQKLIQATRDRLAQVALPQRVYDRIRQRGLGDAFPAFSAIRSGGGNVPLVFARASGLPLTQGPPGLYSYAGYWKGFQSVVGEVTRQLADEQPWVLGIESGRAPASGQGEGAQALLSSTRMVDDVRRLYLIDYRDTWKAYIADIKLLPVTNISQAVERARFLAAPDSPLVPLLRAISRQTTLLAGQGMVGNAEQSARKTLESVQKRVFGALGAKDVTTGAPTDRIESIVDTEFESLRRQVTAPEGGKAPIEVVIARLGELQVLLTAVDSALKGGGAPPPSPLPNQLKADAANSPEPVRSILESLGGTSARVALMQLRESLSREVRAQIGDFCKQAISGRYPFVLGSKSEVTQADFATLFGPSGKFEQMQQRLAPYIDTSTKTWSFRAVDGVPLGNDVGTLPQFQRAAVIRETFFSGAGGAGGGPSTRLEMKPVEMDTSLREFTLDVDGQLVRYAHGPQIPTAITWPGPRGTNVVRVMVQPAGGTGMVEDGPWALYKLFDRVTFLPGKEREKDRVVFDIDGRKAVFDITTGSVRNPFRLPELRSFSCPNGL